jgi:glutamate racemase
MRVGVFDSGVGGLTVLSELRKRFPDAEYVYLGDTAHLPYGSKSASQIEMLSRECAQKLKAKNIDALVVACNTASSLALPAIREVMGQIPVFGMVESGVQAVLYALPPDIEADPDHDSMTVTILVLATSATVRSGAYGETLRQALFSDVEGRLPLPIIEQACPLLVPMIEEGWLDHPILHQTIQEYVGIHGRSASGGIVLLGCTHYPWIQAAIEKALPGWKVINSAQAIADLLERQGILGAKAPRKSANPSRVEWIFTDRYSIPAFARKWMETGAV